MSLASTWLDLVVGVDLHLEMVATPAPTPTPFPHPHCSVVFDPVGYVVAEVTGALLAMATGRPVDPAGPVLIGGRMATVTGDAASMPIKHMIIPPGTVFATGVTPSDAELVVGSKTVLLRGSSAVRAGELALSCSEPVRLPTSAVVSTAGGPGVTMIGGPPAVDLGVAAGMIGMRALRNKWTAKKLHAAVDGVIPDSWPRLRRLAHKSACFFTGHPVNVASGTVSTSAVDLSLPGPLPLQLERDYDSNWCDRAGPLGFGWSHAFDQSVWLEPGCVVVQGGDGRELEFRTHALPDGVARRGDRLWHPVDRCTLVSRGKLRWAIEDADGRTRVFEPIAGEAPHERARGRARLVEIREAAGSVITLRYDRCARLVGITDACGRVIELENDAAGRVRRLWAPAADGRGLRQHAEYRYDDDGDLVEVVDACGKSWRFEYDAHLLVRERDREGLSFYFEYDGLDRYARCVRTWGDGGIYDHVIEYDHQGLRTIVRDSVGATTRYQMDGLGMVTEIVQADGSTVRREYTPTTWLAAEIDELGAATRYAYDERGNRIRITGPDTPAGPRVTEIRYDEGNRPIELVDPVGSSWRWNYDAAGRLTSRTDPLGHPTTYAWAGVDLVVVIDAVGARTELVWDAAHNLVAIAGPDGHAVRRSYDALGQVVAITDALGHTQRRQYDAAGRWLRITEPDGEVREVVRDGEGRVVQARDARREVSLGYAGMGWLASRRVGGHAVQWRHDTEGRVVAVVDERGGEHTFERDRVGRVRVERTVDGILTRFVRDAAGRVVAEHRPDDVVVRHGYDAAGARVETVYPRGGTEHFAYDAAGRLVAASNDHVVLRFDRDRLGRVVAERSTRTNTELAERREVVVRRRFDHLGQAVALGSTLGADVAIDRNAMGDVLRVAQATGDMAGWAAMFGRDAVGDEVDRALPGGAGAHWRRDAIGRPTQQHVHGSDASERVLRYRWAGDRLLERSDVGSPFGPLRRVFEHDAGEATGGGHQGLDRGFADELDRVFATPTRWDEDDSPGGALRVRHGTDGPTIYEHDGEGRLAARREPDGAVTRFHWDDAGRLVQVDRADGSAVAMTYDPLDRRLTKRCDGVQTCFVADADRVLHEWREAAAPPVPRPLPGEEARRTALLELRETLRGMLPPTEAQARWALQLAKAAREFPRLVAELRGETPPPARLVDGEVVTWLFEPGSYAPLARVTASGAHAIVADHVGRPLVVLDDSGKADAELVIDASGRAEVSGDASLCPWRLAGQYLDDEIGLHYNRFRYYDPDAGQYISRDPLGLRTGLRVYAYVQDPEVESDPLGLSPQAGAGCGGARRGAKRGPKTDPNAPHNATIRAEADALVEAENEILAGGGRRAERVVPIPPGGHKRFRRPDIVYQTPDGEVRAVNVGRTRSDGSPVQREVEAIEDLEAAGVPTEFVPYDK
jgi:RHS repeat-associated protein